MYNDVTQGEMEKFGIDFLKFILKVLKTAVKSSTTYAPDELTKNLYRFTLIIVSFSGEQSKFVILQFCFLLEF